MVGCQSEKDHVRSQVADGRVIMSVVEELNTFASGNQEGWDVDMTAVILAYWEVIKHTLELGQRMVDVLA